MKEEQKIFKDVQNVARISTQLQPVLLDRHTNKFHNFMKIIPSFLIFFPKIFFSPSSHMTKISCKTDLFQAIH